MCMTTSGTGSFFFTPYKRSVTTSIFPYLVSLIINFEFFRIVGLSPTLSQMDMNCVKRSTTTMSGSFQKFSPSHLFFEMCTCPTLLAPAEWMMKIFPALTARPVASGKQLFYWIVKTEINHLITQQKKKGMMT